MTIKNYIITVHAIGYVDTLFLVSAYTIEGARKYVDKAIDQWMEENDVGDDARELAFVNVKLARGWSIV